MTESTGRLVPFSAANEQVCLWAGEGARQPALMDLTGLSTRSAAMADPFCVGGGRRLLGSSRNGPGKDGSQNEAWLPVRHDPKLGKRVRMRSTPGWHSSCARCGHLLNIQLWVQVAAWAPESLPRVGASGGPGFLSWADDSLPPAPSSSGRAVRLPRPHQPPGEQGRLQGAQLQALMCCVLQGCRCPGAGTQCLARPHSALTREVQPATGQKGRKRGVRKLRTRPSETFP